MKSHQKQQHGNKYFASRHPDPGGCGQMIKIQHIKLKGITNSATW